MFTENQYLAQQTPAGNAYKTDNYTFLKERRPIAFMNHKVRRFKPLIKSNDPSPDKYSIVAAEQDKKTRMSSPSFSVGKAVNASFVTVATKSKSFVPCPGNYNPDNSKRVITLGARRGYK